MAAPKHRVATTLYTYTEGGFIHSLAVDHYGSPALFIRGYTGPTYSIGDELRGLIDRGGRNMDAVVPELVA